jgi:hypothetical protein
VYPGISMHYRELRLSDNANRSSTPDILLVRWQYCRRDQEEGSLETFTPLRPMADAL